MRRNFRPAKGAYRTTIAVSSFSMLLAAAFTSCSARQIAQNKPVQTATYAPELMCGRSVKFYFEHLIKTSDDGTEKQERQETELTIYPADEKMIQKEVGSGQRNEIAMTQKHCSLTTGMKSGEALYEVVHKYERADGSTSEATFHYTVAATDGIVKLSVTTPGRHAGVKIDISRWELVD